MVFLQHVSSLLGVPPLLYLLSATHAFSGRDLPRPVFFFQSLSACLVAGKAIAVHRCVTIVYIFRFSRPFPLLRLNDIFATADDTQKYTHSNITICLKMSKQRTCTRISNHVLMIRALVHRSTIHKYIIMIYTSKRISFRRYYYIPTLKVPV